jgi:ketosteroid isomerase-like protein
MLDYIWGIVLQHAQSSEAIFKTALNLDEAIEKRNIESVISKFSTDCEIELLGLKLNGRDGVKKWIEWQFKRISKIDFIPITKMVSGNTFFEEYIAKASLYDGEEIQSKQAVVLQFKNKLITSLRLYFDRLEFADAVAKDIISKTIVEELVKKSIEGLT